MTYLLIGAGFCLAAFLALDLLATAWVAGTVRLAGGDDRWSPLTRRRLFAAARVLPSAAALLFAALVVAPTYVLLEPRGGKEAVGPLLSGIGALALVLLLVAPVRALRAWRQTRRVESAWMRGAVGVAGPGGGPPVWRVPAGADGVWTSGLVRPRVFVGASVLEALTGPELEAALRHETAHARGRDNLVRLCLAAAPGALSILPLGRALERRWAQAAEALADQRAAGGEPGTAADLASALVKVARLRPRAALFATTALDEGDVPSRVRALLDGGAAERGPRVAGLGLAAALAVPLAALIAVGSDPEIVRGLHDLAEHLVRKG
jgi:Zn-dependent protease with chaperone function